MLQFLRMKSASIDMTSLPIQLRDSISRILSLADTSPYSRSLSIYISIYSNITSWDSETYAKKIMAVDNLYTQYHVLPKSYRAR